MQNKFKVIIADDHEIFRQGLKMIMVGHKDIEIVAEAGNGQEFLDLLDTFKPDIVLMDIKMPVMDGLKATKLALEKYPDLKVLVISMCGEEDYLINMLEAGVKGFVPKTVDEEELLKAIKTITEGKSYFSQELLGTITEAYIKRNLDKKTDDDELSKLTRREIEVLNLIAKGLTNKEIADALFISQKTVDGHKSNILDKTGSKNVVTLLIWALHNKLIEL